MAYFSKAKALGLIGVVHLTLFGLSISVQAQNNIILSTPMYGGNYYSSVAPYSPAHSDYSRWQEYNGRFSVSTGGYPVLYDHIYYTYLLPCRARSMELRFNGGYQSVSPFYSTTSGGGFLISLYDARIAQPANYFPTSGVPGADWYRAFTSHVQLAQGWIAPLTQHVIFSHPMDRITVALSAVDAWEGSSVQIQIDGVHLTFYQ